MLEDLEVVISDTESPTADCVRLRALQSYSEPTADDNPFTSLHSASLSKLVDISHFSWHTALFGKYDVFHIHWLDSLVSGRGRVRTVIAWFASALLVTRLRIQHVPVVRTLHNTDVRGGQKQWPIRKLVCAYDALTALDVRMNHSNTDLNRSQFVYVPHGHYKDWYRSFQVPDPIPGRAITFGLMRSYKGIPALLESFSQSTDASLSLHLVGRIVEAPLSDLMHEASLNDSRITVLPGHASEELLAREIGQAEIVVLPYAEFYNSGCALLALSLSRPVLVPNCAAAIELASEFGPRWVRIYTGELETNIIEKELEAAERVARDEIPDLAQRDWDLIAKRLLEVYRHVRQG